MAAGKDKAGSWSCKGGVEGENEACIWAVVGSFRDGGKDRRGGCSCHLLNANGKVK